MNRQKAYLVEEPRAEDDLEEVVRDEYVSKLKGLAVLHEPRAQHLDQVDVRHTDGECGERTRHEQPVAGSGVCTGKQFTSTLQ